MSAYPSTLGLILAGGAAQRLGGVDKALIDIGGKTILARAIERIGPQCAKLLLNANGAAARFDSYDLPVVPDSLPGLLGPLAGVLAGLEWAAAHRPDLQWVMTLPGDEPFQPDDLVARLHAARANEGAEIACAASGGRTHPTSALWPISIAPALRNALINEGDRKVSRFMARYRMAVADWPTEPFDPFFNVNTPDDIAEARRFAQAHPDA